MRYRYRKQGPYSDRGYRIQKTIGLPADGELYEKITALAKANNQSFTSCCVMLLEAAVEDEDPLTGTAHRGTVRFGGDT